MSEQSSLDQILSLRQVAEWLGVGRNSIYRWSREGHFPAPIKLAPRRVGWRRSTVEKWLREREAAA